MADGVTPQQAKMLTPKQLQEIEAENLHPRSKKLLAEVLINLPLLTVQEAVQLRASGGI